MDNIFENAKFGDKFVTREGSKAVFIKEEKKGNKTWYKCIVIDIHNDEYVEYYHQDGRINYSSGEEDLDILSKYQEPIDEDKLNEFAKNYSKIIDYDPDTDEEVEGHDFSKFIAFKAGYRKAKEE